MNVVTSLRTEIRNVLDDSINSDLEAQRRRLSRAPVRSLHFTGSFGCHSTRGLIHINIPTGTDKTEKLNNIINRVLYDELNITLDDCRVVKDVVGMSNKVIEFYLP